MKRTIAEHDNGRTGNWLIKGIHLIDGRRGLDEKDVDLLVAGGVIQRIAARIDPSVAGVCEDVVTVDGGGLWLWPGLIDGHVHFREPGFEHKETFRSGGRAAARGGYTSVICEPNTHPPLASVPAVREAACKARNNAGVRTYFKVAMTHRRLGRRVAEYGPLAALPEVVALSDDGDPVSSRALMEAVCMHSAPWKLPLCPHCEDSPRAVGDYAAGVDPGFEPKAPYTNETSYVERDAAMARKYGCRIHFSHLSLQSSIRAVRGFRDARHGRADVTCEVTPHHLLLSERDGASREALSVNPPLRSRRDMEALQEALLGGRIDAIASDHAPHSAGEKQQGACGLLGVETTLGLIMTCFIRPGRLAPLDACRLLSSAPAEIFGVPGGTVTEGAPADLAFIDPEKGWVVDPEDFESLSRNTPFAGRRLTGRAVGTMVGGRLVYADEGLENRIRDVFLPGR